MSTVETLAQKYRALHCNHIATHLIEVLAQPEAQFRPACSCPIASSVRGSKDSPKKRRMMNLRKPCFPIVKRLERFACRRQSAITKHEVTALLDLRFVDDPTNLVCIGPPGVGKTHLAIRIVHKAIEAGYKVVVTTSLALAESLPLGQRKGELTRKITSLQKYDSLLNHELG